MRYVCKKSFEVCKLGGDGEITMQTVRVQKGEVFTEWPDSYRVAGGKETMCLHNERTFLELLPSTVEEQFTVESCGGCKWHDGFSGACCNGESDSRASFTDDEDSCNKWEADNG